MTRTLRHEALPHTGPDGFLDVAHSVLTTALGDGAVPVLVADGRRIDQVRSEFGADASELIGIDCSIAGRNPARVLPALQRCIDEHPDRRLDCLAEQIRAGDSAALVSEVELHELLFGLPEFAAWNARISCTFDTSALAPDMLASIGHRHDQPDADPIAAVERARAAPLPPRPHDSQELGVDRTTLAALRGFVERRADSGGLDDERVDDLVYAVNEVVTNSLCHGEGRARVSFWSDRRSVVCEVRDRGWIKEPLVGRVAPHSERVSGRGLWLVNQLCDLVQIRSSPSGSAVRMFVDVGTPGARRSIDAV